MTQQINLLDPALLPSHEWATGRHIVAGVAALSCALVAHGSYESLALRRTLALNPSAAQAASGDIDPALQQQVADQEQQLQRDRAALQASTALSNLPRGSAQRLQTLIAALPASAWLREVEFSGERSVRIVGGALEPAALADFAHRLNQTPPFQGLPLAVYALEPLATEPAANTATPAATPILQATVAPTYGFVLSSTEAAATRSLP